MKQKVVMDASECAYAVLAVAAAMQFLDEYLDGKVSGKTLKEVVTAIHEYKSNSVGMQDNPNDVEQRGVDLLSSDWSQAKFNRKEIRIELEYDDAIE